MAVNNNMEGASNPLLALLLGETKIRKEVAAFPLAWATW